MVHVLPNNYAVQRRKDIERWLAAQPDWGTKVMAGPGKIASGIAREVIPVEWLRAAFNGLNRTAERFSQHADILKWAQAEQLEQLTALQLEQVDRLAFKVERRAMALAGSGGAVLGVGGLFGMAIDIPALLALAMRTIYRTAYCYGEDWQDDAGQALAIGVFALASANSLEEKHQAWTAIQQGDALLDAAWRDGTERIAEREIAKRSTQFSIQNLASKVGVQLGTRRIGGVIPVLGIIVGASINIGYIHDISRTSRYVLQARWMAQHYGVTVRAPNVAAVVERAR